MQKNRLCLPMMELMLIWNGIRLMSSTDRLTVREMALKQLSSLDGMTTEAQRKDWINWSDDRILCMLVIGVTYLGEGNDSEAEQWFKKILGIESTIVLDHWQVGITPSRIILNLIFTLG